MAKNYKDIALGKEFVVKEYVELANDAAQRTRWIIIVLMIATAIIGIGFYNSSKFSWARNRIDSRIDSENIPINNTPPNGVRVFDANFSQKDFIGTVQFKSFACDIYNNGKNANKNKQNLTIQQFIYSYFNQRTRELLSTECADMPRAPSKDLINYVNNSLNVLLADRFFYNRERFAAVTLGVETKLMRDWALKISAQKEPSETVAASPNKNTTNSNVTNANVTNANPANANINSAAANNNPNAVSPPDSFINIDRADLKKLNRMLLEDTYPEQIQKSSDIMIDIETDRARQFALWNHYIGNVRFVEIPVFGIAIDVNDLGFIGGISLFIILSLMRFILSREIKNLNISFRQSYYHDQLKEFYHSLAMRQVLTVPEMEGEKRNQALLIGTKYVCLIPVFILFLGIAYDSMSVFYYKLYPWEIVRYSLLNEGLIFVCVCILSLRCLERQIHIDQIWEDYYKLIKSKVKFELISTKEYQEVGDKKLVRIFRNYIENKKSDKYWFFKIFERKNFYRLIPNRWLSRVVASRRRLKYIRRTINYRTFIFTLLIFGSIISIIGYIVARVFIESGSSTFENAAAIVFLIGIAGNLVMAFRNWRKWRKTEEKSA